MERKPFRNGLPRRVEAKCHGPLEGNKNLDQNETKKEFGEEA
jgi:hypothetical protein